MPKPYLIIALAITWLFTITPAASAQSFAERLANAKRAYQSRAKPDPSAQALLLNRYKMVSHLPPVNLKNVTAQDAVVWLEDTANITVLVNWQKMLEEYGVDPETEVLVVGHSLTAQEALDMILKQISIDQPLKSEITPWYIRIITKAQADANPILRMYPIGDMIMGAPDSTDVPEFDLQAISQSSSSGGGGGGGGGGSSLFDDDGDDDDDDTDNADARATELADLIRTSIEPTIWRANGGAHSSITIYENSLVVRAPLYVHKEIGGDPLPPLTSSATTRSRSGAASPSQLQKEPTFRIRRRTNPDALYKTKSK